MDMSFLRPALLSTATLRADPPATKRPAYTPDTNGTLLASSAAADDGPKKLIHHIRDIGFRAYAEEEQKKKLELLRKQILGAMGLNEEDLANMSQEQRNIIEDMIAEEIRQRLAAQNDPEDETEGLTPGIPTTLIASDEGSGTLGIFLALQERDLKQHGPQPQASPTKTEGES